MERCERAVGETSEMCDGCWYFQVGGFSGLGTGIGLEIQEGGFERARLSLVVMEAAVVSVGWEWVMGNMENPLDAGSCLGRKLGVVGEVIAWVVGSVAHSWPPSHWASRPAGNEAKTLHRELRWSTFRGWK